MALLVARLVPFDPQMPARGLDPSWQWALNDAIPRGLSFGGDIVFTGGPASSVVTGGYHPSTYVGTVLLTLLLAIGTWLSLHIVCGPERRLAAGVASVVLAGLYDREGLLIVIPLLALLAIARTTRGAAHWPRLSMIAFAAVACGTSVAAKGSTFVVSGACVIGGTVLLARARRPWLSLVNVLAAAGTFLTVWVAYGQSVGEITAYASGIAELASGYTDAMSLGSPLETLPLLVVAAGLACFLALTLARVPWLDVVDSAVVVVVTGATAFTATKLGLVRADQHLFALISALTAVGFVVWAVARETDRLRVLAGMTAGLVVVGALLGLGGLVRLLPAHQAQAVVAAAKGVGRFVGVAPSLDQKYLAAQSTVRETSGLPPMAGSVDIYSSDQADLLSIQADWSPRPVFQSYAAFTPDLAEMNRRHLAGPGAPQWVVFAPQPIDERYPSAEDGPSWLELLRRYEPAYSARDKLVLSRRPVAREDDGSGLRATLPAVLGQSLTVPRQGAMTFIAVDIRPSPLGHVCLALFKSEPLRLTVRTADGVERTYRLPLGMAQAGFLLSPTVATADDFAALYLAHGADVPPSREVAAITLDSDRTLWSHNFTVTITPVSLR
ncbi:hypothetical protein [Terracoccus sp. 273MFTsu3.1]|uniref:hypothetical protein n=1 Tax=Terracoccus sp. 273MFTsu3.1 TaxID=1172188 RepID=UPI001E44B79D|nr:hypothetical protein [Terracoccus sp. 273MFTsu3.1]